MFLLAAWIDTWIVGLDDNDGDIEVHEGFDTDGDRSVEGDCRTVGEAWFRGMDGS